MFPSLTLVLYSSHLEIYVRDLNWLLNPSGQNRFMPNQISVRLSETNASNRYQLQYLKRALVTGLYSGNDKYTFEFIKNSTKSLKTSTAHFDNFEVMRFLY
jgi:hypothetical protein